MRITLCILRVTAGPTSARPRGSQDCNAQLQSQSPYPGPPHGPGPALGTSSHGILHTDARVPLCTAGVRHTAPPRGPTRTRARLGSERWRGAAGPEPTARGACSCCGPRSAARCRPSRVAIRGRRASSRGRAAAPQPQGAAIRAGGRVGVKTELNSCFGSKRDVHRMPLRLREPAGRLPPPGSRRRRPARGETGGSARGDVFSAPLRAGGAATFHCRWWPAARLGEREPRSGQPARG